MAPAASARSRAVNPAFGGGLPGEESAIAGTALLPVRSNRSPQNDLPEGLMRDARVFLAIIAVGCVSVGAAAPQTPPAQHKPDHMQHRFDDPERYAKSFDDPARDQWQMPSRVIEVLQVAPDATVADIGAGTGYFTMRLAKAAPRGVVYAVDVEAAMLEHIRKRASAAGLTNVSPVQASGSSPNLPKPVDLVLIVDTYHHLPNRPTYFRDLSKSLTAGGRVAIVDFRKDSPEGPPRDFRFDAEQIIDEMKQAGYQLDRRHDFLPRQHFLVFRRTATGA
jgi:predicted methyltransferase